MKSVYIFLFGIVLTSPWMTLMASADGSKEKNLLTVSQDFPALKIDNQFAQPLEIESTTQQILFAASKSASDNLGRILDAQPADWLQKTNRVYIADIHKMPKVISRMVALPKMKKLSYSIFLGRDADDTKMLPQQDGCVTAIDLNAKKVASIGYACNFDELKEMLLIARE